MAKFAVVAAWTTTTYRTFTVEALDSGSAVVKCEEMLGDGNGTRWSRADYTEETVPTVDGYMGILYTEPLTGSNVAQEDNEG
jgi:hypothetical protein